MPEVVARIELPEDPPDRAARVRVLVEDVSRADAASEVVGETVLESVPLGHLRALEVAVTVADVDQRRHYACRVHVDTDDSGRVASGHLISTQSHPVLTRGHGTAATVPLTRI